MNFIIFWLLNLRVNWMLIVFWKKAVAQQFLYGPAYVSCFYFTQNLSKQQLQPQPFIYLKKIYFWLCWVFVAAQTFLQLWHIGFSLRGFSCGRTQALEREDFSSCSTWVQQFQLLGSTAQAQQLWCMGLVVLSHVASSLTRDRTRVSCISRQILYH